MAFLGLHKRRNNLTDEELLEQLHKTQDMKYFQLLYERYMPLAYGLSLKYLKDAQLAQDAVIDVYEDLAPKIMNYQIEVFKNWLYSVVKNHCFAVLRASKKEIIVDFDSNLMESDSIIDLLDENNDEEKAQAVNDCISQLPEPQRVSVVAFFYENKSYVEIVELTGYNMKSVKSYLQNGKRNLKICLEKKIQI